MTARQNHRARQDRLITKATPRAAELVEAVANHDREGVAEILAADTETLHALAIVLASWVDPESTLMDHPAPGGSLALATRVVGSVARRFGLATDDLTGRSGRRDITDARAVAAYVSHRLMGVPSTTTGRALAKDHTTILHACARVGEDARLRRVAHDVATAYGWVRGIEASA